MFEATLYTAEPDRQRLQRLTFAAAIALASTATALASMWTIDRLHIDRLAGPAQKFELAALSLLPPPKVVEPPPPPPELDDDRTAGGGPSGPPIDIDDDDEPAALDESPREIPPPPKLAGVSTVIPGLSGPIGCPACIQNRTGPTGPGTCVGPHCGTSSKSAPKDAAPPTEVEFSALRCLACADPDRAALRKTSAGMQGRTGKVVARFCVDVNGRVEASSVKIERSYGDATVDRITRDAIEDWRFSPMKVGNQPRRACSRATFNIRFD